MTDGQLPEFLETALKRQTRRRRPTTPRSSRAQAPGPAAAAETAALAPARRAARLAVRAGLAAFRGARLLRRARFLIGIAGMDRRFDGGGAPFAVASRSDIGSIVFEPEALTGARP